MMHSAQLNLFFVSFRRCHFYCAHWFMRFKFLMGATIMSHPRHYLCINSTSTNEKKKCARKSNKIADAKNYYPNVRRSKKKIKWKKSADCIKFGDCMCLEDFMRNWCWTKVHRDNNTNCFFIFQYFFVVVVAPSFVPFFQHAFSFSSLADCLSCHQTVV